MASNNSLNRSLHALNICGTMCTLFKLKYFFSLRFLTFRPDWRQPVLWLHPFGFIQGRRSFVQGTWMGVGHSHQKYSEARRRLLWSLGTFQSSIAIDCDLYSYEWSFDFFPGFPTGSPLPSIKQTPRPWSTLALGIRTPRVTHSQSARMTTTNMPSTTLRWGHPRRQKWSKSKYIWLCSLSVWSRQAASRTVWWTSGSCTPTHTMITGAPGLPSTTLLPQIMIMIFPLSLENFPLSFGSRPTMAFPCQMMKLLRKWWGGRQKKYISFMRYPKTFFEYIFLLNLGSKWKHMTVFAGHLSVRERLQRWLVLVLWWIPERCRGWGHSHGVEDPARKNRSWSRWCQYSVDIFRENIRSAWRRYKSSFSGL